MSPNSEQILNEALALPPIERAELVEQLLSSFDFPVREEIDTRWAQEAEDRIGAFERGDLKSKSVRQVFDTIDQKGNHEG